MAKEFKTIEEQMDILRQRGMQVGDSAYDVLLTENYYSVVNGYKEFFMDSSASEKSPSEVYRRGTEFDDLHLLFLFDRELRETTLHYLLIAEAHVKTVCVYSFCERFGNPDDYLDDSSYTDRDDYLLGKKRWRGDLSDFKQRMEYKAYRDPNCREYIRHYREDYGFVPLWVLANSMTFGNVAYFFNLQKRDVQSIICKRVKELRGDSSKEYFAPMDMRLSLRTLVDFRNICAHDERLFCAKVGKVGDSGYLDMVDAIGDILPESDVGSLIDKASSLIDNYTERDPKLAPILHEMKSGLESRSPGENGEPA